MKSEKLTVFVYADSCVFVAEVPYDFGFADPKEFEPYDLDRDGLADDGGGFDGWRDFGATGSCVTSPGGYASGAEESPLRYAFYDAAFAETAKQSTYPAAEDYDFAADEDLTEYAEFAALAESLTAMSDFSYDGDVYDTTSRAIANLIVLLIISLWINQ